MKKMLVALGIALVALPSLSPCLAQHSIAPGDATFRIDRVRLATDTIAVLVAPHDSAEALVSTLIRRIERLRIAGDDVFRETQFYESKTGRASPNEFDTLEVSARTLELRRIVEVSGENTNSIHVDHGRLVGIVTLPDSGKRAIDAPLFPLFHDMMDEAFVGAFPLDTGTVFRVPVIRPPSLAVRQMEMRITGRETIRTANGPVACLMVSMSSATNTAHPAKLWIAVSDHHLVRLTWTLPNGTTVWKLPLRDVSYR